MHSFLVYGRKFQPLKKKFRKINSLFEAIFSQNNRSGSEKLWSYMTSTDGGGYHKSGSAERCSPPPINTHRRYLHVEILQLCPMKLETWCWSSLVSSYSCWGWMGSGQTQELAFDLTSFSLTDDASSLLLALPESSLQEICELYCTQEQNISLSFYRRGAAYFQGQKSSITQMKPRPLHLGREN